MLGCQATSEGEVERNNALLADQVVDEKGEVTIGSRWPRWRAYGAPLRRHQGFEFFCGAANSFFA
jgi:hypothetical protein